MAKILIIDDDASIRDYLTRLVTRLSHQVVTAATCAEGIAQLSDTGIHVIIADIYLPDSPPLEQWINQLKVSAANRPLILITGEPSDLLAAKARGGEITALLTKPFELAFIKSLLAQVTSGSSAPAT